MGQKNGAQMKSFEFVLNATTVTAMMTNFDYGGVTDQHLSTHELNVDAIE